MGGKRVTPRRLTAGLVTVALLAAALYAAAAGGCRPKPQAIWSRPDAGDLPAEVSQWVQLSLPLGAGQAKVVGDVTYLLLTHGPQPEGAAATILEVVRATPEGTAIKVIVKYTPAPPGTSSTAPARPYDLVRVDFATTEVAWTVDGDQYGYVMQVLGPLQPIVAESRWIKLFGPAPDATVSAPFTLSGLASAFEGTINFRVVGADGAEIVPIDWATGAMGDWGFFTKDVEYVVPAGAVDPATGWAEAKLEVFTISAEDGEEQGKFIVPLRLLPSGGS